MAEAPHDIDWWRRPAGVRRAYCDGRFGQMHYRVAAPAQGRRDPVLLFHQSPSSGRPWERLVAELGRDRMAVAPDTPGLGDSDPPPAPPTIEEYAAAMGDLMDALGVRSVNLIGDHTGTKVAIELARQRPTQVRRLVLNAAMVFTEAQQAMQREMVEREKPHTPPADGHHHVEHFVRLKKYYADDTPLELINRDFAEMLRGGKYMWYGHNASFQYPVAEAIRDVTQPILLLCPDDGFREHTLRTVSHMRNGTLLELPQFRMGAISMHAAELAKICRDFFDVAATQPAAVPSPRPAPKAPPPRRSPVRRRFVEVSTGLLHLRTVEANASAKTPLYCFHISPFSGETYEAAAIALGSDRLAIAVDTPGYGESDRPIEKPTLAHYVRAISEAASQLGHRRIDVLGDHTGGKVALALAAERPDLVRKVVLNTCAVYTPEERQKLMAMSGPIPTVADGSHLAAIWKRSMNLKSPLAPLDLTSELFCEAMRGGPLALWWGPEAAVGYDSGAALGKLVQPVLLLLPGKDMLTPLSRRAIPLVKNITVEELPDVGLGTFHAHLDAVVPVIRRFLDA
ncbi:MAG: alpha/beta hydrolase [Alphaproteobacteria bacterium]|nr:alpha/beta hydrolase [Alphaproteobacteria bacterium]